MKGRKQAREKLLSLVFSSLFLEQKDTQDYVDMCADNTIAKEDKDFVKNIYEIVFDKREELIGTIKNKVKDFSLSQIFKLDLSILLIGAAELLYTDTEKAIVLNEAVELAKKFSTPKSGGFVNGVLSSLA